MCRRLLTFTSQELTSVTGLESDCDCCNWFLLHAFVQTFFQTDVVANDENLRESCCVHNSRELSINLELTSTDFLLARLALAYLYDFTLNSTESIRCNKNFPERMTCAQSDSSQMEARPALCIRYIYVYIHIYLAQAHLRSVKGRLCSTSSTDRLFSHEFELTIMATSCPTTVCENKRTANALQRVNLLILAFGLDLVGQWQAQRKFAPPQVPPAWTSS